MRTPCYPVNQLTSEPKTYKELLPIKEVQQLGNVVATSSSSKRGGAIVVANTPAPPNIHNKVGAVIENTTTNPMSSTPIRFSAPSERNCLGVPERDTQADASTSDERKIAALQRVLANDGWEPTEEEMRTDIKKGIADRTMFAHAPRSQ
jgi:hypothetical protein